MTLLRNLTRLKRCLMNLKRHNIVTISSFKMAFALFQEIAELSDKLVEQSAVHETRSQDFESKLRDVRDNLESRVGDLQRSLELVRNDKCELERKAEKLRELLEERDTSIKVSHSCFSMSLSVFLYVCRYV